MKELWTNWRGDLLRYNVTKKKLSLEAAAKGNPPKGLDKQEWSWLIKEIFSKDDFKVFFTWADSMDICIEFFWDDNFFFRKEVKETLLTEVNILKR